MSAQIQLAVDPIAVVEPPHGPSPAERRAVRDGLDEHYLEDKGCYRQAFSDKALAAKLDVPARWVADLREAMGLGPDANEANAQFEGALAAVKAELEKLGEDFLARHDLLAQRLKRLEVDRAYAPKAA